MSNQARFNLAEIYYIVLCSHSHVHNAVYLTELFYCFENIFDNNNKAISTLWLCVAIVQRALRYDNAEQLFRRRRLTHASLTTVLPLTSCFFNAQPHRQQAPRGSAVVYDPESHTRWWSVYSSCKNDIFCDATFEITQWVRLPLKQNRCGDRALADNSGLMMLYLLATNWHHLYRVWRRETGDVYDIIAYSFAKLCSRKGRRRRLTFIICLQVNVINQWINSFVRAFV